MWFSIYFKKYEGGLIGMKKKERMFEIFIYLLSSFHILVGIIGIIMSRNIEKAGILRLMLMYMTLFGATLMIYHKNLIEHNKLLYKLRDASAEAINSLIAEIQQKQK